jgi:tRNA1(Val) A37 N6-methylase TrmN6
MSVAALPDTVSDDALLGGRVRLYQPLHGYRVAIDPVLLAAAVTAAAEDKVLDIGCGVGAASLCLAARVPGCRIVGMDYQHDLIGLAAENVARNGVGDRVEMIEGDLLHAPASLQPGSFTQVMANPPFLEAAKASASPVAAKAAANVEGEAALADWLRFALAMLKDRGTLTLIHRADRLGDVLAALAGRAGAITVFPLWPGAGKPAGRILLQARKGNAAPLRLLPGLVLHEADGRNTETAEAVLRHAAPLVLAP